MSDGPHRTLPMRSHWKRVAECVYNPSFTTPQIAEALRAAVAADVGQEVPQATVNKVKSLISTDHQADLLDGLAEQLTELRKQCSSVLEADFLDAVLEALGRGVSKSDLLETALKNALCDRLLRAMRSVEEHHIRKSPDRSAGQVRSRMDDAAAGVSLDDIVKDVANGSKVSKRYRLQKNLGIDDGVPLP